MEQKRKRLIILITAKPGVHRGFLLKKMSSTIEIETSAVSDTVMTNVASNLINIKQK